ncbi:uncharacterized protein [Danio rerio]|uniref:Uncharacterized protein n=1 Tax=Danio rerio TaxID=7955 RepID=A0AC58IFG1_DANRE|nr:pollen-specific leucine-rich repeat extensin-like protein 1 [Danio rerio]|eukprot:XP_009301605.2 pollen-specific leucine-rich repeat extensin-like protein 1 [Danio rerio]
MKKGPLHFLSRKNHSLYDTNVDINKEMGNLELMLDSAAIPESGTAKVRSRPTVKHFTSTDGVQGFAVPTPKVPVLPPFSEPKINGTGNATNSPKYGSMMSIPDVIEGEILIPPPPSSAPPPPPSSSAQPPPSFIPPTPHIFGEIDPPVDRASLQPPPMAPPKPPSHTSSGYASGLVLSSIKPPSMAPPKPPSETSSFKGSLSSLEAQNIPDCPKFNPPPPPVVKTPPVLSRGQKAAPPKPVRMSSIPSLDIQSPAPPVASNPTPSSFNPQNTAKLYNVQKSTTVVGESDREKGAQSILLLQDSAGNTVGVVNGNGGKNAGSLQSFQPGVPPSKPARQNSSATQLKEDQLDTAQAQPASQPVKIEAEIHPEPPKTIPTEVPMPVKASPKIEKIVTEVPTPMNASPKIEKKIPEVKQVMATMDSPGRSRRYSPVLNHRKLRSGDGSAKKETSTSPFALLMAAKEREKQKTALSQQNSNSDDTVIQPSVEKTNSFPVIPKDLTPDSPSAQLKASTNMQPQSTRTEVSKVSYSKPELSFSPQLNSSVPHARDLESGEDLTFIPPPPEFANSDTEDESSVLSTHPASAPPVKTAPPPTKSFLPSTPTPIPNLSPPNHPAPAAPSTKTSVPAPITSSPNAPAKTAPPPSKTFLSSTPAPITNLSPPSHPAPVPPSTKTSVPAPITNSPNAPATALKIPRPAQLVLPSPITSVPPPSYPAPALPPSKPSQPFTSPPISNGPLTSPKPKPPSAPPKAPGPPPIVQPQSKSFVPTKSTQNPTQAPPSVAASQATLLSILQKKMLEMDPKISAAKEVESNGDDWNSPMSDDEATSPPAGYNPKKPNSAILPAQSRGLDMKELESKAAKAQEKKSQSSSGASAKQQYGMTFTVRPGSKQPITPVIKDN